jgi:hypothetical protein
MMYRAAMMMFYFDLQTDGKVAKDLEGADLPDLDAARVEANRAAREMAAAAVAAGNEAPVDDILITDAKGGVLATVSLSDMIPHKLRR